MDKPITGSYLISQVARLNKEFGLPEDMFATPGNTSKCNLGHLTLEKYPNRFGTYGQYTGYRLEQIGNEAGGTRSLSEIMTAREMNQFIKGLLISKLLVNTTPMIYNKVINSMKEALHAT